MRGALALVVALAALVAGPASGLSGSTADGAGLPSLTVVGDARYRVEPDAARVRVTVGLTIRNRRGETVTRRSWYDRAYLAIQPSASGIRVSGAGGSPSVRVTRTAADHKLVEIRFGKRVYSNQTIALRLSFDLRDRGGAPGRFVRIGPGLVSFPVWAFASDSTPGARATVVIPAGLEIQHGAGAFTTRTARDDGTTELATAPLTDATRLRAYVVNSNNNAEFTGTTFSVLDITDPAAPVLLNNPANPIPAPNYSAQIYLDTTNGFAYMPNRASDDAVDTSDSLLRINVDETSASFGTIETFNNGENPFGIACCDASGRIYVVDGGGTGTGTIAVFDPA